MAPATNSEGKTWGELEREKAQRNRSTSRRAIQELFDFESWDLQSTIPGGNLDAAKKLRPDLVWVMDEFGLCWGFQKRDKGA